MPYSHERVPSITDMAEEYKGSKEKVFRDRIEVIQLARSWMLRALLNAYQQDENKIVQKGTQELAYLLTDGKWPVSLSAVIRTSEGDVSVGVRRVSGKREGAVERLGSNSVPVNMIVKDGEGHDWMIGNLVGREGIDTHLGIFACQLDEIGNLISVDGKLPYRGVDEVMSMSEIPVSSIFQYMAEQENRASEQEFVEGLRRNSTSL
jgi:hypothetical protein